MAENRVERKLAAILAADVVGYSRLMHEDEAGTLARLKALRRDLFEPKTKEYRGRVFKTTGDGALVEFKSAVDAINSAVDIQRALAEREAGVSEDHRIRLRIGVSLGDVIVEGSDLYGRGVNIAARMEGLAEPGGICISGNVHEHVRGAAGLVFDDLGNQEVKNIPEPVRAFRVRLGADHVAGSDRPQTDAPPPLPDKPSIAVLPFQNMSGDPEQDYFCDGMVEDIITGLSRIKWLFVIARNSSFIYKGRAIDVKQVGRELGVRYVLEGSVRKSANRVRITGQLIEAQTGVHLWADRYDRPLDDTFALQDEITLAVVGAIEPSLRAAEIERVKRKRPESLDAYDLLLRAISTDMAMPEGVAKALPLLERVLALEPNYARAHGHKALCHHTLYLRGGQPEEDRRAAIHHAHAAIANGQDDSTALTLAGFAPAKDGTAYKISESRRGTKRERCLAIVRHWHGRARPRRCFSGFRNARSAHSMARFALGHFSLGHYQEAAAAARKAIQFNPGFSMSHMLLAASLMKLGRLEEAKSAAAHVLALQPSYRFGKHFTGVDCAAALAASLSEALRAAGLPE